MTTTPLPETPTRRAVGRLLRIALGLAAGAVVAEAAFFTRDRGAFPHLNVYVADERLGVRLRPGAEERVAFNGNPLTHVRIDADGFRGPDLPPPGADEILVLGDSQAFGLGVEEDQTFSAELGRRFPGRNVIDLGVPTYGPLEYGVVLEEALARRGGAGAIAIYTVNLADDLFEADRPNRERHAVWDGWAVRAETAPAAASSFPGRALVFRESHAVFALRSLLARDGGDSDAGFASEGSWSDLLGAAAARKVAGAAGGDLGALVQEEERAQRELEVAAEKAYPDLMLRTEDGRDYRQAHGSPKDIVVKRSRHAAAESSRDVEVTVDHLIHGAAVRQRVERTLRKRAEREIRKQKAKAVLASLAERDAIETRIAALGAAPDEIARSLSPLRAPLEHAKALCDARGARLVVLALPLDVMVSDDEWAKYGAPPRDTRTLRPLLDDVIATAAALGIDAVDATPALAAAEPGAFLLGDLHLTPKGHRAVADALAPALGSGRRRAGP